MTLTTLSPNFTIILSIEFHFVDHAVAAMSGCSFPQLAFQAVCRDGGILRLQYLIDMWTNQCNDVARVGNILFYIPSAFTFHNKSLAVYTSIH